MTHKLIKTENYLLVVDDSEIKESRLRYIFDNRQGMNGFIHQVSVVLDSKLCPKIIAHLPLNNSPILEGVDLLPPLVHSNCCIAKDGSLTNMNKGCAERNRCLPPLEDEVEKLANKWAIDNADITMESNSALNKGFKAGYNTAKEKYKYTEEDLVWAIQEAYGHGRDEADDILYHQVEESIRVITKYLQQPKMPVAFECEMEYKDMVGYWYKVDEITKEAVNRFDLETRPKTTTNSQGQTVLVGTYKYK